MGGLNVSRAFGDLYLAPTVIHKPKITVYEPLLNRGPIFLELSCDGIRDFLSDKEVFSIISSHLSDSSTDPAKTLVDQSRLRHPNRSKSDNVTAICVKIEALKKEAFIESLEKAGHHFSSLKKGEVLRSQQNESGFLLV